MATIVIKLVTYLMVVALPLIAGFYWYLHLPVFGSIPEGERLEREKKSPHFRNGSFENPELTKMLPDGVSYWDMLRAFIMERDEHLVPSRPLPSFRQDLSLPQTSDKPEIIWFGHSSYLLKINGKKILVDPVFSERTSPSEYLGTRRFDGTGVYTAADMPPVDLVIITHDHYDHLDYATIIQWKDHQPEDKPARFLTSLGVGAHLERWGISADRIRELDWWESDTLSLDGFTFTAVPARHFSGRAFSRNKTLWSGFVLETTGSRLFLGGDSGYGRHFAEIGEKFGPFDLVFLENGQYSKYWHHIHMMPEETVQAAIDLKARFLFPVHWGKYALALHAWDEPIRRLTKSADARNVKTVTPLIGETVVLDSVIPAQRWWEAL